MLIILEGADGSGKTTLFNNLTEIGAIGVIPPEKNFRFAYSAWCKTIDDSKDKIFVCDRSFITDLVYRIVDDKEPDTVNLLQMILLLQRNNDVKVIHCRTDTSFDDAIKRGEDNIVSRDVHTELEYVYDVILCAFMKFSTVPILEYNWKINSIDDAIDFIRGK